MPLRVSFDLDDGDLQHFEQIAQQTQAIARSTSPDAIIATARDVLQKGSQSQLADFVKDRYARLRTMIDMVCDAEWSPSPDDRQRVINALACFSSPAAAQTDTLLDHAIMIELVGRDLHHDIDAYREFCRYRETYKPRRKRNPQPEDRERALAERRDVLQKRMHERRRRDLEKSDGAVRKLFSLFGL
jgi:hypothetical protein